jgi:hypothetical protein
LTKAIKVSVDFISHPYQVNFYGHLWVFVVWIFIPKIYLLQFSFDSGNFYAPRKFWGSILTPVCPPELISLNSYQKLMLLITHAPRNKDLWTKISQGHLGKFKVTRNIFLKESNKDLGRSLKIILESSRSHGIYF